MKYNIITTCNESYFPFLKIFLKSAWENLDFSNINQIYVFNSGLNSEQKEYVSNFKKITIIDTNLNIKKSEMHDGNWEKITYSKIDCLKQILDKDNILSFMIDSDSIFHSEFIDLIDLQSCIFLCEVDRVGPGSSPECPLIGSFYGINPGKCDYNSYLNNWNNEINKENVLAWKESPALQRTYLKFANDYRHQLLQESIISHVYYSPKININPRIFHLKSDRIITGELYNSIEKRLKFDYAKHLIERYK